MWDKLGIMWMSEIEHSAPFQWFGAASPALKLLTGVVQRASQFGAIDRDQKATGANGQSPNVAWLLLANTLGTNGDQSMTPSTKMPCHIAIKQVTVPPQSFPDLECGVLPMVDATGLAAGDGWRLLSKADEAAVRMHFLSLSQDAFRHRFGAARSPYWVNRYLDGFFERSGLAVGLIQSGHLIALGEVRRSVNHGADVCEFGLSVADHACGQGIGLEMVRMMRREAKTCGFPVAEAFVDYSNRRMRAVFTHFENTCTRSGGTLHFRIPL